MSQVVGLNFKSKIPTLGDDASIEEALRVYHYGVDQYSGQPIPEDSIEGNFSALDQRVTSIEGTLTVFNSSFVRLNSLTATPNVVVAQSTTTIPLTVRAIASQTSVLQAWQNSSSGNIATMSTGGAFGISGYISVGSTSVSSGVASSVNIVNASHKGIVVKAASSQTANLQEWTDNAGGVLASINGSGAFSVSGNQTVDEFRIRNIRASTSQPSGGNDGDVWFVYV